MHFTKSIKVSYWSLAAESDRGFNLILIDPPWENSSAHQKQKYAHVIRSILFTLLKENYSSLIF